MPNALDTFRAQREAADQVHARLTEVSQLLTEIRSQADAVAGNAELRAVLRDEQHWLREAQSLVADVRHFREQERQRFWPGVWRRWLFALVFALASAAAAGAGYTWATQPYTAEITELRDRAGLLDVFVRRMITMTPAERRQFDALMKWNVPTK